MELLEHLNVLPTNNYNAAVSKRASVSYGARVCRVMHADPETTNRFVREYGTFE